MAKSKQQEFPGFRLKKEVGEPNSRLMASVSIVIKDTYTGEAFNVKIPVEAEEPKDIVALLANTIVHEKTVKQMDAFLKGREGATEEEDEEEGTEHNGPRGVVNGTVTREKGVKANGKGKEIVL